MVVWLGKLPFCIRLEDGMDLRRGENGEKAEELSN